MPLLMCLQAARINQGIVRAKCLARETIAQLINTYKELTTTLQKKKEKKIPIKRMISKTVTIQSANKTLKDTPILMPSMSIGWMSSTKS
jgi:ribosomal protein L17